MAGSDFPGSDAGTSVHGGSVAGSVAATHGSGGAPARGRDPLRALLRRRRRLRGDVPGAGGPLEEDEGEYGSEGGDESGAESDPESDEDKETTRRRAGVVRARRPPPARAVSREGDTPVMVVAAAAAAEAQAQAEEKA